MELLPHLFFSALIFAVGFVLGVVLQAKENRQLTKRVADLDDKLDSTQRELNHTYEDLNCEQKMRTTIERGHRENIARRDNERNHLVTHYNNELRVKVQALNEAQAAADHMLTLAEPILEAYNQFSHDGNVFKLADVVHSSVERFVGDGPQSGDEDHSDEPTTAVESILHDHEGQQFVRVETAEQFADIVALIGASNGDVVMVNDLNFADAFMREVLIPAKIADANKHHSATEAAMLQQALVDELEASRK